MYEILLKSLPYQECYFTLGDYRIRLEVRYNSIVNQWVFDVYDEINDHYVVQGMAMIIGVPMLWRSAVGYYFWLSDESLMELDPVLQNDLGNRCFLYVGLKSELDL